MHTACSACSLQSLPSPVAAARPASESRRQGQAMNGRTDRPILSSTTQIKHIKCNNSCRPTGLTNAGRLA
eukprot:12878111-Alexandrium_andersonii.AAC.1